MRKLVFLMSVSLISLCAKAGFEVTFDNNLEYPNNIPEGWRRSIEEGGDPTFRLEGAQSVDGEYGLLFRFDVADPTRCHLTTTKAVILQDEIECDNVCAQVRAYVTPPQHSGDVDNLQIVISTNNFENGSYEAIGDPIPLREAGRTKAEWKGGIKRSARIPGLSSCGRNVSVGIVATTRGWTQRGYLGSVKLDFVAVATPQSVHFEVDGTEINSLTPGVTNAYVMAVVDEYPTDEGNDGRVSVERVYCVLDKNGDVRTNDMSRVGSSMQWKGDELWRIFDISPTVDAAERITAKVYSEYRTARTDFGKLGEPTEVEGVAREASDETSIEGTKKGSVWINEFTTETVELCGTTNRVMLPGWSIELVNQTTKETYRTDFPERFDFSSNMTNGANGVVGLVVKGDLKWTTNGVEVIGDFPVDNYALRLRNSAGIVEHEVSVRLPLDGSVGMTGYSPWKGYEYDWSGTATDGPFAWGDLSVASFGAVNYPDQGFKVPVEASLRIKTGTPWSEGGTNLSYVTVIASGRGLDNDESATEPKSLSAQSQAGVATIAFERDKIFSATPEKILVDLSVSAFGWACKPLSVAVTNGCTTEIALQLTPTVAGDGFSKLESYWTESNSGIEWPEPHWAIAQVGGEHGGVLRLDAGRAEGGTVWLKCSNFLASGGKKAVSISFDDLFNAWMLYTDSFHVEIATNQNWTGTVYSTPFLSNAGSFDVATWSKYKAVIELPEEFSKSDEIWVRLVCVTPGWTNGPTTIDNLRIAFEDVALPTNLTQTVEKPVSGGSTGFVLDVLPQTADEIEEVSADLHITVNGEKKIVPFAHPDGSLTNRISIADGDGAPSLPCATKMTISPEALEKVCGKFYAGQTVTYYAAVHYNSANGDTDPKGVYETRYFPDNATIDDEGRWIVEGEYKAMEDQYGFTVDGPDIEILGEPRIDVGEIGFDYHAWDRTGNKGITNLTLKVETDGFSTNYVMFAGDATNRVTDAFMVPGLVANTTYILTLSGQRNTGHDLMSTNYTFTTLGEVKSAKISGTSTSGVKLTVDGLAEKYAVEPSDWVQKSGSATVWMWEGGSPNTVRTATIKAVNSAGMTNEAAFVVSGYTLAANPNVAPAVTNIDNVAVVWAEDPMVIGECFADGNPTNTEYAVRVRTSRGIDSAYISDDNGVIWKTLTDWAEGPVTNGAPIIDLIATNYFRFVARNTQEHVETANKEPESKCWFDMTASFVDNAAYQAKWPFADGFAAGYVAFTNVFFEPATSKQAQVKFAYQLGDTINEKAWIPLDEPSDLVDFDELCVTNGYVWNARASVEDDVETSYFLRAMVSKGDRSGWAVVGGRLDFVKPTVELTSKASSRFNTEPLKVDVTFSEAVVGFTKDSVKVSNGEATAVVTNSASSYTVDVMPTGQGARVLDISVWVEAGAVTDVYGNENVASKEPKPTWTYDTVPPTVSLTSGTHDPFNEKGSPFVVTAEFSEPVVGLLKDWVSASNFSKIEIVTNSPSNYTIKVTPAADGEVTVTIAKGAVADLAGNPNVDAVSLTHKYDTTPPVLGDIEGWPTTLWTNTTAFSFTISATDESHPITYEWSTNNDIVVSTATNFTGNVPGEGVQELFVTATDAAGNVSEEFRMVYWGVDLTKPTDPVIEAESSWPKAGAKTNDRTFSFTATSEDQLAVSFYWQIDNGPLVKKAAKEPFTGAFSDDGTDDGEHTVSVYSVDLAGNRSTGTTTQSWTLDTTAPALDEITGTPAEGAKTNGVEYSFSIALTKTDLTDVTFHWLTNGVWAADVTNFTDKVAGLIKSEGEKIASVYATDAAGNVSVTNSRTWTVDWTAPEKPDISGEPQNGSTTNLTWFTLKAAAKDNLTKVTYHWTLDGGKETLTAEGEEFKNEGMVADGDHTVLCYAVDEAFNVSETNTWSWTVDTKPPENFHFEATPNNTEVVATSNFNFMVSATDTTTVTYYWKTNEADYVALSAEKKDGAWVANFEGLASEGTNTLSVYGTDQLGNPTVTNSIWWVVDTIAPTVPVIDGTPADGAYTKEQGYSYTAKSEDATILTYFWTLNGGDETEKDAGEAFAGSGLADGGYTVSVYAKDEAGNVSAATNWNWTVDTVSPKVTLKSSTPTTFNEYKVPLIVDVAFTEPVVGFNGDCVTVTRGVVTNWTGSGSSYTVYIDPDDEDEKVGEAFVPVTVQVEAGKVRDLARNPNEASDELQFRNVTKFPTVSLETTTRDPFRDLPFEVTATFVRGKTARAAVVTNFTAESVSVTNGTVEVWPDFATNVYTITVTPVPDSVVTVQIPAGVVADDVGNPNEASIPLVRTYDVSAPANLRFLDGSTPAEGEVTASRRFDFEVAADDLTALTYTWELNGKLADCTTSNFVSTVDVPKGTNIVSVFATDAAGNFCDPITRTWIVDYIAPTNFVVTGTPGVMGEIVITNGTFFSYVADAEDDTRITYCWTTNGVVVADNPTNLVGTAIETTNTVTCYAMDQAKNVSETNTIVWVVDTIPPKLGELSGTPKVGDVVATNGFAFATSAEDATALTYHWMLNGELVGCTTSNYVDAAAVEGTNTLSVYVTDAAGNVSETTNTTWWVVDRIAPTVPEIEGTPADGSVTSNRTFRYTASSTDATVVSYSWRLSDGRTSDKQEFSDEVMGEDGAYTVSVTATDEAGNWSATNWTWTLDTIAPTNLTLRGLPIADDPAKVIVTNGYTFAFTASAGDATAITYHWATNGVAVADCTVSNFVGYVSEGTNTVSVYAMDAASNVCESVERTWVVDTRGPSLPTIGGKPTDESVTNECEFDFKASASDDWSAITFHWALTDGRTAEGPTFKDKFKDDGTDDGPHAVSVWAIDEAGNVSPTNSLNWVLDTIAPKMPVIVDAFPTSNSFVNVTNYNFKAAEPEGEEDATAVKFFWRIEGGDLDGKKEVAVTNFEGKVGMDGAYTAFVYATDAAGNISTTNSLSWTVDTQIPTNLVISGWPTNGSLTNGPNYCLTATADDATTLTYHWTISDVDGISHLLKDKPFEGTVADGAHTVSCYATDAAGNVSTNQFWSWTSDTTGPTNLVLSVGTPSEGAVVATNGYDFTVSAMDLTEIAYSWTLNGNKSENTTSNFVGTAAREGTNTLSVTAKDKAGNPSEETLTRTWVVDTLSPTNLVVTGTPGDGALTNDTFFSWTASAQDATRLKYHWSLLTNGVEAVNEIVTNEFTDVGVEGTNTVTVYAKDEAGNVSAATNVCWMVDLTPPTVELLPEISTNKVINLEDVTPNGFKVAVDFNEPVTGFTAASVTVANGTVTLVETNDNGVASYAVWVKPSDDYEGDEFTVEVKAGAVKDLAGNGNEASETLTYKCDVKRPSVTLTTETPDPFGLSHLRNRDFVVKVAFSEQVTNFTASSVIVTNGAVSAVTEKEDKKVFEVTILPTRYQFDVAEIVSVQVGEGVVADLAGNRNVASEPLTRKYDHAKPTKPVITGTPTNGAVTAVAQVNLFARSEDMTQVSYYWYVNGVEQKEDGTNLVFTVSEEGKYVVEVFAEDAFSLQSDHAFVTFEYKTGTKPSDVDFGGGVTLPVSEDYVTNSVSFTAVDFRPGDLSTFVLSGFKATGANISGLTMWFRVCDTLSGERWYVPVNSSATYDLTDNTLTVTIQGDKTMDETGKPFESFFIFGIDNKGSDE